MRRRQFLAGMTGLLAASPRLLWADAETTRDDELAALLEPIRKEQEVPALAAAVVLGGKTIAAAAVGVRKHGEVTPVTHGDQFHLGSCTKAMTATLAGMLIDEGKLAWDSTLGSVFPDLATAMHPSVRDVTLDQCLAHRAGFTGLNRPRELQEASRAGTTERERRRKYLAMVLPAKPEYEPGSKFEYSNRGYVVIGAMLEQVSDSGWEELIAKRLFEPLGMTTAGFGPMGTPGKLDQPRQHRLDNGKPLPVEPLPFADNPPLIAPAGRVHCSIGDWAKYVQLHLAGEQDRVVPGAPRLVKPETIRRLHAPQFGGNYAGGWGVVDREWGGGKVLTHAGSNTMNYSVAWLAPRKNFAVLVATNMAGERATRACDQVPRQVVTKFLSGGDA